MYVYNFCHQDFEDWDDVGLNIPKPAGLLCLWRDYGQQLQTADTSDAEMQTDEELEEEEDDKVLRSDMVSDSWSAPLSRPIWPYCKSDCCHAEVWNTFHN